MRWYYWAGVALSLAGSLVGLSIQAANNDRDGIRLTALAVALIVGGVVVMKLGERSDRGRP